MSNSRSRRREQTAGDDSAPHFEPSMSADPGGDLAAAPYAGLPTDSPPDDWDAPAWGPTRRARDMPPLRLHATIRHTPRERHRLSDRVIAALDRVFRPRPFLFSERNWRRAWWQDRARMFALAAMCLLLMLGAGLFAFTLASRAAAGVTVAPSDTQGTPASAAGIIVQSQTGPVPTPAAASYMMGVWSSSSSPTADQPLQIFVRITRGDSAVAGVTVSLGASFGGGWVSLGARRTDGYGLAVFTVPSAGAPNVPVVVSASAAVGGQMLSGDFQYLPQKLQAAPSPTPTAPPLP